MTDTPETAEWEPDEPDNATDTPADTPDEQPATPPEPPPGMKYDASGKLVEAEPRSREATPGGPGWSRSLLAQEDSIAENRYNVTIRPHLPGRTSASPGVVFGGRGQSATHAADRELGVVHTCVAPIVAHFGSAEQKLTSVTDRPRQRVCEARPVHPPVTASPTCLRRAQEPAMAITG